MKELDVLIIGMRFDIDGFRLLTSIQAGIMAKVSVVAVILHSSAGSERILILPG
jgi:hypothetical protein